jgi:hypothetical protein
VLNTSANPATRLEAMLVLGRLAARCVAVQQDAVREGAVPVLVQLMQQGEHDCLLLCMMLCLKLN